MVSHPEDGLPRGGIEIRAIGDVVRYELAVRFPWSCKYLMLSVRADPDHEGEEIVTCAARGRRTFTV